MNLILNYMYIAKDVHYAMLYRLIDIKIKICSFQHKHIKHNYSDSVCNVKTRKFMLPRFKRNYDGSKL